MPGRPDHPRAELKLRSRASGGIEICLINAPVHGPELISVFDVRGRLVTRIDPGVGPLRTLTWDGKNSEGHFVASGIYFVRVVVGETILTGKTVLVR
jgi:hypothetical protein